VIVGIDFHNFHFLRYAFQFGGFGSTLTSGRQNLHVRNREVSDFLAPEVEFRVGAYCEPLLGVRFGATRVDSVDASGFEGATFVHDMNKPIPEELFGKYDTIFDGGCLEHIFNAPQALWSLSKACRKGGQILHSLPANNFCGHGFWQFSPELFHSLYSTENGYVHTEVFIADLGRKDAWFKVARPSGGKRINIHSATPLYVLVRTVKADDDFRHDNIQQSDYVYAWSQNENNSLEPSPRDSLARRLRKSRAVDALRNLLPAAIARPARRWRPRAHERLDADNPGLTMTKFPATQETRPLSSNDQPGWGF